MASAPATAFEESLLNADSREQLATPRYVGPGVLLHNIARLLAPPAFEELRPDHVGLTYRAPTPARRQRSFVDVYLPRGSGPHPSVVLAHGGAFLIGSRALKPVRFLAGELCRAGYVVACYDYRKLLRGGRLAEGVADASRMLAWWSEQTERFQLDPARVTALGLSAGATLTLLATARPAVPLAGVISVFALYDLGALTGHLPALLGRMLLKTRDRARWTAASPIAQPLCPRPLTMLHGTADGLTPLEQAERYLALREAAGLPTRLHVYTGAPHGFLNDARAPVARQAIADIVEALGRVEEPSQM